MVTKYSQSPGSGCSAACSASIAGRTDRRGGQTLRDVGVPWRLLGPVGVAGGHLAAVQRIVHGRVELQRVVSIQPVVDDLRHLREVLRIGFLLHQRRHHQDVVGRQLHRLGGVHQRGLRVHHGSGADQVRQDVLGRGRGIDVEGPGRDQALDPAMIVAQLGDGLNGPGRHGQHVGWGVAGRGTQVVRRDAVLVAVEIHTGGAGEQRQDSGCHHVGLHVGGVVELTAFRDDQLAHPVAADRSAARRRRPRVFRCASGSSRAGSS